MTVVISQICARSNDKFRTQVKKFTRHSSKDDKQTFQINSSVFVQTINGKNLHSSFSQFQLISCIFKEKLFLNQKSAVPQKNRFSKSKVATSDQQTVGYKALMTTTCFLHDLSLTFTMTELKIRPSYPTAYMYPIHCAH